MSIKQKLVNWAFGDAIRAEAERLVKQAATSVGVDPDESRWRGLTQSRRDLIALEQDRLIEIANYLAFQNPLGKKIRETRRDFVIGDGVTFDADDKKVIQPLIDEFWNDPVNNMDEYQIQLVDYLGINGELFLPAFINDFSGMVRLGWIDPVEVDQVIPDRHNRRIMRKVMMKPGASAGTASAYNLSVRYFYDIVNVDTEMRSPSFNLRIGNLLHFRINCAPDATRGRSDFESIADLVDAWDQATFNDLERVALLLNFIWDVKLTGKTEPEIQEWLRSQAAPKPGSIRAHNENVEWQAVAPQLSLYEVRRLTEGIRKDVLGSAGLSEFFFGITEGANKASSENLDLPILKGLMARQRAVKAIFREIVDFVIDQAALKKPGLRQWIANKRISRKFEVVMPELSTKDLSRVGAVLAQITTALDIASERGWISRETAAKGFASFLAQFGVEYDPMEEMGKADEERDAQAMQDYTQKREGELRGMVA